VFLFPSYGSRQTGRKTAFIVTQLASLGNKYSVILQNRTKLQLKSSPTDVTWGSPSYMMSRQQAGHAGSRQDT